MTAGDYSGRGYGHDDQGYPSYYDPTVGYEGYPERPWPDERSWPGAPARHGEQVWPADPYARGEPEGPAGYPPEHPGSAYYTGQFPTQPDADGYFGYGQPGYPSGYPYQAAGPPRQAGPPYADPGGPVPGGWTDHTAEWAGHTAGWQRVPADDDGRGGRRAGRGKRRGLPLWQELPLLLIIAFCLAILVRTFLLQAFYIPSGSMEDTLEAGDRVLVNKVVYNVREPVRGEVVVFQGTEEWTPQAFTDADIGIFAKVARTLGDLVGVSRPEDKEYIKRIIGLPGDRISCCNVDGQVFVNGQPLQEEYLIHDAPLADRQDGPHDCRTRRFDEVVVEPGQMFVMGDHRAVSQDSRCQGQVPVDNIIGRAFVIVWPSSRWTGLQVPDAFESVPQAGAPADQLVDADPRPGELAVVVPFLLVGLATFRQARRVPGASGAWQVVGSRGD